MFSLDVIVPISNYFIYEFLSMHYTVRCYMDYMHYIISSIHSMLQSYHRLFFIKIFNLYIYLWNRSFHKFRVYLQLLK